MWHFIYHSSSVSALMAMIMIAFDHVAPRLVLFSLNTACATLLNSYFPRVLMVLMSPPFTLDGPLLDLEGPVEESMMAV